MPLEPIEARNLPHPSSGGYVLFDALVALLLVATTLLGAGLTLVQSLASSRAAAMQTSAVDLLADLTELLHDTADRRAMASQWASTVARQLPSGDGSASNLEGPNGEPVSTELSISWRDHADAQQIQLHLPVVLSPAMALP